MIATPLFTFVALQAGWFACVMGAASGRPLLGPLVVALVAAMRVALTRERDRLLGTLAGAALLGIVLDGALTAAGVLHFPPQAIAGWPVPIWMVALWVNFGLAVDGLAWFGRRPLAAALAGAAGGPLSYLAGARLGAVTLAPAEPVALAIIAMEWGLALPLLLCAMPATLDRRMPVRELS